MQLLTLKASDVQPGDLIPTETGDLYPCLYTVRGRGNTVALTFDGIDGPQSFSVHRTATVNAVRPTGCQGCPLEDLIASPDEIQEALRCIPHDPQRMTRCTDYMSRNHDPERCDDLA